MSFIPSMNTFVPSLHKHENGPFGTVFAPCLCGQGESDSHLDLGKVAFYH